MAASPEVRRDDGIKRLRVRNRSGWGDRAVDAEEMPRGETGRDTTDERSGVVVMRSADAADRAVRRSARRCVRTWRPRCPKTRQTKRFESKNMV